MYVPSVFFIQLVLFVLFASKNTEFDALNVRLLRLLMLAVERVSFELLEPLVITTTPLK